MVWTDADGNSLNPTQIEDNHLVNIIKFCFEGGALPPITLLHEAQLRGLIKEIGKEILPRPGYKSREELLLERGILPENLDRG